MRLSFFRRRGGRGGKGGVTGVTTSQGGLSWKVVLFVSVVVVFGGGVNEFTGGHETCLQFNEFNVLPSLVLFRGSVCD